MKERKTIQWGNHILDYHTVIKLTEKTKKIEKALCL